LYYSSSATGVTIHAYEAGVPGPNRPPIPSKTISFKLSPDAIKKKVDGYKLMVMDHHWMEQEREHRGGLKEMNRKKLENLTSSGIVWVNDAGRYKFQFICDDLNTVARVLKALGVK
jgi:hypothetical protein